MLSQKPIAAKATTTPPNDLEAKKPALTTVVKDASVNNLTILGNKVIACCVAKHQIINSWNTWNIQIFDINTLKCLSIIPMQSSNRIFGSTPDGKLICKRSDDVTIRVWDILTNPSAPRLITKYQYLYSLSTLIGIDETRFITIDNKKDLAIWEMVPSQSGIQLKAPEFLGKIPPEYLRSDNHIDKNIYLPRQARILCVGPNGIASFDLQTNIITGTVALKNINNIFCSPDQSVVSVHHGGHNDHQLSLFQTDTLLLRENLTHLPDNFFNPSCVIGVGERQVAINDATNHVQIRQSASSKIPELVQLEKLPWKLNGEQHHCEMKVDDQNKLWVATNEGMVCIPLTLNLPELFHVIADELPFALGVIGLLYEYAVDPVFRSSKSLTQLQTEYVDSKQRVKIATEQKSPEPASSLDKKVSARLISNALKTFEEQFAKLSQQNFSPRFSLMRNLTNTCIAKLAAKVNGDLNLFATTLFAESEAMKTRPHATFAKAVAVAINEMQQQHSFAKRLLMRLEEKNRGGTINTHLFDLAINLLKCIAEQETNFNCDAESIAEVRNVAHELIKHSLKKQNPNYAETKIELLKMMQDSKNKIKDLVLLREIDLTYSSLDASPGIVARMGTSMS